MLKIKTLRKYFWKITLIAIFIFFAIPSVTSASTIFRAPSVDGLVGYWNFDINAGGSTAYDMSGQANNGTMVNMDPATDWVDGKVGSGALDFDGSNDYVNIINNSLFEDMISNANVNKTLAVWFNADTLAAESVVHLHPSLMNKGNVYMNFGVDDSGELAFMWYNVSAVTQRPLTSGAGISTGSWYHGAVVLNEGTITLYVNGVNRGSDTFTGIHAGATGGLEWFGTTGGAQGTQRWDGKMDEVRVYNRALSAEEITNLYNSQKKSFPTTVKPPLSNGLVGYWNFDIGAGGSTAYDMSGNANHGTLTNMDPATDWVDGKVGSGALDFDGVNDYVNLGLQPDLNFTSGNFTIAAWVKPNTNFGVFVGTWKTGYTGYNFYIDTKLRFYTNPANGVYTGTTTLGLGIWHYVAITVDSSGNYIFYLNGVNDGSGTMVLPVAAQEPFEIGAYGGTNVPFNGLIDDVRVYNRALSAEEIQRLYKATAGTKINKLPFLSKGLVGYWDLNDGAGSTMAKDKSGQGYNGTLTNMDPATDWVDGKVGSGALDFDGVNDHVRIGSPPELMFVSGDFTIAGWMKPNSVAGQRAIAATFYQSLGYIFGINNGLITYLTPSQWHNGTTALSTGVWYHAAVTVDSSGNYILYLNGVNDGSGSAVLPQVDTAFSIGASHNGWSNWFNGLIDDVRVYNRALSAEEIQRLYDLGNLKP